MANIEITNNINDLEQEFWQFCFLGDRKTLTVSYFIHRERKSKRHGWKTVRDYNRTFHRENTVTQEQLPLTESIKQQALSEFVKDIVVTS